MGKWTWGSKSPQHHPILPISTVAELKIRAGSRWEPTDTASALQHLTEWLKVSDRTAVGKTWAANTELPYNYHRTTPALLLLKKLISKLHKWGQARRYCPESANITFVICTGCRSSLPQQSSQRNAAKSLLLILNVDSSCSSKGYPIFIGNTATFLRLSTIRLTLRAEERIQNLARIKANPEGSQAKEVRGDFFAASACTGVLVAFLLPGLGQEGEHPAQPHTHTLPAVWWPERSAVTCQHLIYMMLHFRNLWWG